MARTRTAPTLLLLLVLAVVVPSTVVVVQAQQQMPFLGRGDSPPASPVDVHVSAFLDKLLTVDDKKYEFSVSREDLMKNYITISTKMHIGNFDGIYMGLKLSSVVVESTRRGTEAPTCFAKGAADVFINRCQQQGG